ncbi:tyrosine-type recombinase/integrase [Lactiplantibacillus sp. WILCCON 0030]|uniref:Tyrosine-type recombinase/integrase n=1 Tax=Lactiplantibacillus brownii TaxID=3069269 RepID=A0ABU1A7Y2_9LACO|nr:tyrosine-type recombinase/integrase [Lactiplantibacillus brownii]MDQ7937058.1 tyrosine-type recombinase/integrase [Lactiplantibacillus brownii]
MKLKRSNKYKNVYSYVAKKGTLYAVRFTYYDLNGKRREKQERGFKTELLAYKAELALEIKYANNDVQQIVDSSMKVSEWVAQFIEQNKLRWRPSTKKNYLNSFNKYVIPLLGNEQLEKLTRIKYQRLYIDPLMLKLSPITVENHNRIMMSLMNCAVENDILAKNKLKGIKFPKTEPRKALSREDLAKFNKHLPKLDPEYTTLFMLLELTGMRLGEAFGLTWTDINLHNETVRINKSRGSFGVGPTKTTAGTRTIAMTATLTKQLKHYRLHQKELCLKFAQSFDPDHYVFTSSKHNSLATSAAVDYNFHIALEEAGVEKYKYVVHCLRHTHATYLLNSGINPVDVAKRLGHSNANITLGIYAHALDGSDSEIALKIDKIVGF